MSDHSHPHDEHGHEHDHEHEPEQQPAPETPVDAGSQALSEALRSSFAIVKIVMVVLVVVFLASGFFQVGPSERGIILRLGKPVGEGQKMLLGPGIHWSFPAPIDEHTNVSVTGIQRVTSTVGWYFMTHAQEIAYETTGAEPPPAGPLNPAIDGYTITADTNIIHVRATLYYHINDPASFIFGFVDGTKVVQNALNNAILYTSAHFGVDDILTRERAAFQDAVRKKASDLLDSEKVGVAVDNCTVESTWPRQEPVSDAFRAVLDAEITRSKVLQDAHNDANRILSQAGAEAQSLTNAAEASRDLYVKEVASAAGSFSALLPQYRLNPNLYLQERWNNAMGQVLTNVRDKIYLAGRADGKTRELRLLLNREPPESITGSTNQ